MTIQRYEEAEENNEGYCTDCKDFTTNSCEPDARNYKCDVCRKHLVFGASECLIMGLFELELDGDEE